MEFNVVDLIIVLVAGYVIGGLPFAVWIAKWRGVDIFTVGSGSPGATNVKRSVGKMEGNLCFLLDAAKGALAAGLPLLSSMQDAQTLTVFALIAAILGHSFSIWIGFRGGKGVATTIGGLTVIMWQVILIGLVLWLLIFFTTRYVSLASITLGVSLPISAYFLGRPEAQLWLALLLAILILVRHTKNIQRLIKGEENRFGKK